MNSIDSVIGNSNSSLIIEMNACGVETNNMNACGLNYIYSLIEENFTVTIYRKLLM